MKSHLMASYKRIYLDARFLQKSWKIDFDFVSRDNRAVCVLCC